MSIFSRILGALFPRDPEVVLRDVNTDWPTSVVDLLKALGRDSSFEGRRRLAAEWGRPAYSGSEEQNIWLHGQVMARLRSGEWTRQS
jgi:hypothetical protein